MTTYKILVADDEQNFRDSMKRLFHLLQDDSIGFEIVDASGGEDALTFLKSKNVDCVLIDYQMPGGNGIEWLRRILEQNRNTAVIMVTGMGSESVAVEAMKSGATDYLVKGSITPESLFRAVLNAVQKIHMRLALEKQREKLMDAERQRVMIESLGAACHHLGQPATVITTYLRIMQRDENSPDRMNMITNCLKAAEAMDEVLRKLQTVSRYRPEPYYRSDDDEARGTNIDIVAIG
jgi:DNA-binding NtrC family response regulator